jgi:hypothetical protein
MNLFWNTIALYNSSTWIYQIFIILLGYVFSGLLIKKPQRLTKLCMKLYFIFLYSWIAVVYYYVYCNARSYNGVLAMFWGIMVLIWVWDTVTGYTTFERLHKYDVLSYSLMALPLLYPLVSLARGMSFPAITSPVMPSSVITFTIGLLLLHSKKVNIFLVLFLCHWSLIGLLKTYFFNIPEDFLLAIASIPALYIFLRRYFLANINEDTKPKAKYINAMLIVLCALLGVILMTTMIVDIVTHHVN